MDVTGLLTVCVHLLGLCLKEPNLFFHIMKHFMIYSAHSHPYYIYYSHTVRYLLVVFSHFSGEKVETQKGEV